MSVLNGLSKLRKATLTAGLFALGWMLMAIAAGSLYVDSQLRDYVDVERADALRRAEQARQSLDDTFERLAKLPAALGRQEDLRNLIHVHDVQEPLTDPDQRDQRAAELITRRHLRELSRYLSSVSQDLDVSRIHVMDAAGEVVADSGLDQGMTLIGYNLAQRTYFDEAKASGAGLEFAVGMLNNEAGFNFASPVFIAGTFVGMVVVTQADDRLIRRIGGVDQTVLVSDPNGIVVLASRPQYLLTRLPGAAAQTLPAEHLSQLYRRIAFRPLPIYALQDGPDGDVVLFDSGDDDARHILVTTPMEQGGYTIHVADPLPLFDTIQLRSWSLVGVVMVAGLLMIVLVERTIVHMGEIRDRAEDMDRANKDLQQLNDRLTRLAVTDPLTNVYNRRHFFERADQEMVRARRYGHGLAVLYLDIDHFKNINDTFGHGVGDEILKLFAATLVEEVRTVDIVGRLGGEEFAILLPETRPAGAAAVGERIRRSVERIEFASEKGPVRFTVSIGIASQNAAIDEIQTLCKRADEALYAAKRGGRNKVSTDQELLDAAET